MGFKDKYRATKAMIEAQRASRKPFEWEGKAKTIGKILMTPITFPLGAILCSIDWMKKKLSK